MDFTDFLYIWGGGGKFNNKYLFVGRKRAEAKKKKLGKSKSTDTEEEEGDDDQDDGELYFSLLSLTFSILR